MFQDRSGRSAARVVRTVITTPLVILLGIPMLAINLLGRISDRRPDDAVDCTGSDEIWVECPSPDARPVRADALQTLTA